MRQTLWAEKIVANKKTETVKVDDYIHIHVIPEENKQLLNRNYKCSGKGMEETWRSCIKDQSKYVIISPKELLATVLDKQYCSMIDYIKERYW